MRDSRFDTFRHTGDYEKADGAPRFAKDSYEALRLRFIRTQRDEVDAIEALSADEGFPCFRDDPIDLLDRDLQAARTFDALLVVVSAASHLRRPPSGARTVRNQLVGVRIMRFGEGTGRPCPAASPARPEGE